MKIPAFSSLRVRMFAVLVLVSVIPAVLTLIAGTLVVREVVRSTGSAGAWEEVAASGRTLLDRIQTQNSPSPELVTAAERHQVSLEESLRFSRLYAFIGERVVVLLPLLFVLLLILVAALAGLAANWLARGFARPVEELVRMTRSLVSGAPAPTIDESGGPSDIREFEQLRSAIQITSEELGDARLRELAQARTRTWSEMARRIAHELKNPLAPMAIAADRVAKSDDPSLALAGEVLKDEIRRLDELARTFAQFGRPPEAPMSPVDLVEMVSSLARRLTVEGSEIQFTPPTKPAFVMGHLDALERVFRNILSNAHDAVEARSALDLTDRGSTPQEGENLIEISLSVEPGWAEVRVSDRGIGIPEELVEHIWEPEFTTRRKGTGLGLAMVRQVVHAQGGQVHAANRAEGGAEFTVRLPALEAEPGADSAPKHRATTPR